MSNPNRLTLCDSVGHFKRYKICMRTNQEKKGFIERAMGDKKITQINYYKGIKYQIKVLDGGILYAFV